MDQPQCWHHATTTCHTVLHCIIVFIVMRSGILKTPGSRGGCDNYRLTCKLFNSLQKGRPWLLCRLWRPLSIHTAVPSLQPVSAQVWAQHLAFFSGTSPNPPFVIVVEAYVRVRTANKNVRRSCISYAIQRSFRARSAGNLNKDAPSLQDLEHPATTQWFTITKNTRLSLVTTADLTRKQTSCK